jgi:hypothetical protein
MSTVFVVCFANNLKNSSKIIFVTLFLFSALRYDVGWDYMSYLGEIKGGVNELKSSRFEPLSKVILLASAITNFYPLAFIVFAFLTLKVIKMSIDRYSYNSTMSWLVYYSMPLFFFASLSGMRQSLAAVIILYSFHFAKNKKFLYFLISIIIASLIHSSALVGFLILPLTLIPVSRNMNILFLLLSFFISSITKTFFLNNFGVFSFYEVVKDFYIDSESSKSASLSTLQYLYFMICIFNLVFYNKLVSLNVINKQFITLSTFGIIIYNLLSFEAVSATRICTFFILFWIYLFPYYAQILSKKTPKVTVAIISFVLITLSFFYLNIYINAYENGIQEKASFLPYKFWF